MTLADLRVAGTRPEDREELMSVVRKGAKSGEIVWRREEGMGSRGQEVARFDLMSLSTTQVQIRMIMSGGYVAYLGLQGVDI